MTSCYIPQLSFSFYRHRSIRVDFSGGQITSDAGLLPVRAFDERYSLTRRLAELLDDPREEERVRHSALSLFRQRIYQIVAGYEDANDADRLRHDPAFQILADQPLGEALGSQPTLSRWENAPSARNLVRLNQALLDQFIRLCGQQVRRRGEILLDIDSTDDPTHGQQQLSFFNGAYNQHMYHPMLIFERHTGCLLAARLRPGNASSHGRIVPMLLRLVPRLEAAFPGVPIKLRGDAGFALPLLYEFCEFFGISMPLAFPPIACSSIAPNHGRRQLQRRYRRTQLPQRSFSSFPSPRPLLATSAPHLLQGRTHGGRNQPAFPDHQLHRPRFRGLRFLQRSRRVREPHRGVQERLPCRPPELPSLSGQRLPPAPARLRLQPGQSVSYSATTTAVAIGPDRNSARPTVQNRCSHPPDRPLHPRTPGHRLAVAISVPRCLFGFQYQLACARLKTQLFLPRLWRSISQKLILSNQWSTYTLPASSNCPHEEPGHENLLAEDENSTPVN